MSVSRYKRLIQWMIVVASSGVVTAFVHAQPVPQPYDQIDLTASAEKAVDNDVLVAIVYAEVQNDRQSVAANEVNQTIQWALREAERARDVDVQTLQYASFPVYGNNRRIIAWQARQSLRLESRNAARLSELLGTLQERVAVQSVSYDVSKEARNSADDQLITEALAQFNRRAALVASELGRPGYRIVRISINTGGGRAPPMPMFRAAAAEQAAVAPPALDAGVQTVEVTIGGTIELDPAR